MKICLLSNHSADNVELARLTAQNRWDYSARHGYDLVTLRMPYEKSYTTGLIYLFEAISAYDAVFAIGSDVVITNPAIPVESFLRAGKAVSMSAEIAGRSLVNNDVAVWSGGFESDRLLEAIIEAQPQWRTLPNLWQSYLAQTPALLARVAVLEPRALNATDQSGDWLWQPGDFVCHCLGGHNASKVERCRAVLEKL